MKNLIVVLLFSVIASAQIMTNVTATLQDSAGQTWSNATWTAEFSKPPGSNAIFLNQGHPITPNQTGTTDNVGHFAVTLDDNFAVSPTGSGWKFTICPNASVASCNTIVLTITGPNDSITLQLNAIITVPVVEASPIITRAYNDSEVKGSYGALYVNTISNQIEQCSLLLCNGTGWIAIGPPINNPIFTGTLTVPCVAFFASIGNTSTVCAQNGTGNIAFTLPTIGGSLIGNTGVPSAHQVAVFVDAFRVLGISPGTAGLCFMSNGLLNDPSFQTCGGGGGGGSVNPGTGGQFAWYATTGSTISGNTNLTDTGSEVDAYGAKVCTATNGACGGGGGGSSVQPLQMIGAGGFEYFAGRPPTTIAGVLVDSPLHVWIQRFVMPYTMRIVGVNLYGQDAAASGDFAFAFYDASLNLIASSGTGGVTNSFYNSLAVSFSPTLTLPPGEYYLAQTQTNTTLHTEGFDMSGWCNNPLDLLTGTGLAMWGYISTASATQPGGVHTPIIFPAHGSPFSTAGNVCTTGVIATAAIFHN